MAEENRSSLRREIEGLEVSERTLCEEAERQKSNPGHGVHFQLKRIRQTLADLRAQQAKGGHESNG